MMKRMIRTAIALALGLVFMLLAACSSGTAPASDSASGSQTPPAGSDANAGVTEGMTSIVRFGRDWPTYYDPAVGSSYTCSLAQTSIYDSLVFFDNETNQVVPHVASSWDVSEDGMTYTFHLRDDVKFHSGNILKASDVAYSMKRLLAIGQGPAYLYTAFVEDCYATDDTTFVVKLNSSFAPFINTLPRFFIVEEALVKEHYDMSVNLSLIHIFFPTMKPVC